MDDELIRARRMQEMMLANGIGGGPGGGGGGGVGGGERDKDKGSHSWRMDLYLIFDIYWCQRLLNLIKSTESSSSHRIIVAIAN